MDIDRFWELIEQARADAGPVADRAARAHTHDKPDLAWTDDTALGGLDSDELAWAYLHTARPEPPAPDPAWSGTTLNGRPSPDASTDPGIGFDGPDDEVDEDDPVATALVRVLARLEPAEIVAFECRFDHVRATADRADLAAAAMLIERGPLTDDGLDDFRAGLVALGRSTFEAALVDPDSLAGHPAVQEIATGILRLGLSRDQVLYAAGRAYVEATGRDEISFLDEVTTLDALTPLDELPSNPGAGDALPGLRDLFPSGR